MRIPVLRRLLVWASIWIVVVLVFVSQNVLRDVAAGRPIRWFPSVLQEVLYWLPFVAATPLFAFMASRFPIEGSPASFGPRRPLLIHGAAALGFAALQPWLAAWMTNAAAQTFFGPDDARTSAIAASLERVYPALVVTALWKYAIVIAVISATRYYRSTQDARVRTVELERQLASSQLSALKMQLHPHFLFNALNSAAMLAITDPKRSHKLLLELAELFRATLSSTSILEVPLRAELDFLDRYLGIERIRFEDRLVVTFDVAEHTEDLLVPSLILQPLVENSIRHGLAHKRDALHLIVRSRLCNDRLVLEVQDDGGGLAGIAGGDRPPFGVGLTNVEQRLKAANGDATPIEFDRDGGGTNGGGGGLVVRLRLPIRRSEAPVLV